MSSRPAARAVDRFLRAAATEPSALLIEGDAGIGKTTLWLAALEKAQEHGVRVLAARAAEAESVMSYATLADLLTSVDPGTWAALPEPQRVAVERVLLLADHRTATEQRAVAAAFLSVLDRLADHGAVVLAIDDLQWLDQSSRDVIAFATRRLSGPVGVLGTIRTESPSGTRWLQLPRPDALSRILLSPLTIDDLHKAVSERLQRTFPRATMRRIHQVSGGNPFYAIELARAMDEQLPGAQTPLPRTLADLVRARVAGLHPDVHDALLAAACVAAPTVDLVAEATVDDRDRLVALLEQAESKGIITLEGNRIQFSHPLLAQGVYADAAPDRRRMMHRRMADVVDEPELRARHLGLASTTADAVTLQALDAAAESARVRGAPAAAAELLDLAVALGGDTAERLLRSALHHFDAGDLTRAGVTLEAVIRRLPAGDERAEALNRLAVVRLYQSGLGEAIPLLQQALDEMDGSSPLRVQVLISLAHAYLNTRDTEASSRAAEEAVVDAEGLGTPALLSLALAMRTTLAFLRGEGLDQDTLDRALALEDPSVFIPLVFRPSMQQALLLEWIGRFDDAHKVLHALQRRCAERGEESEQIVVAQHLVFTAIWRGDFAEAGLVTEDSEERARHVGGATPVFLVSTMRAVLAAYAGQEAEARQAISEALDVGTGTGSIRLTERLLATLGFLEVSLGRHAEALLALEPMLARFDPAAGPTEMPDAAFLPDAIEAMVHLGRLDDATPLVEALERNGRRLDRPWMLAMGARGRALLLGAAGDLRAAASAAEEALHAHDRLGMPFERARSLLLLGRLQRRQRRTTAASAALQEALDIFCELQTPLWADRARAELTQASVGSGRTGELTPSEQRVAELAASGMTNRDVAAALFISPKTVEANLARIYRKLGIKSRAELGKYQGGRFR